MDDQVGLALSAIERYELPILQWGYTHGSMAEDEVLRVVTDAIASAGEPEAVLGELIEQRLVFERIESGKYRYRSRFAESVRLLANLRQLLAKRPWLAAPSLVSDYRVDARQRRFPRRDIAAGDAIRELAGDDGDAWTTEILRSLLRAPEGVLSLSAFQVRAAVRILESPGRPVGTVIAAGTGSGKTLAFYLPVYTEIAGLVDSDHWVKALTIYPRNELLKDQFSEAYRLARQLDEALHRVQKRPITIGTLFGSTPTTASDSSLKWAGWKSVGNDWICPFLSCPGCEGELVWRALDVRNKREQLECNADKCGMTIAEDTVVLTRERAKRQPPDVMFTSMEMLNQRLCDTNMRLAFGLHPNREKRARFVLLDEVHTYSGATGAHSAFVLRRWRHALGAPVRFVGLSATLIDAQQFFSDFTNLRLEDVKEIRPEQDEFTHESMEYQLLLRGDPVSQTALLSTSIQASFLLPRLLDPRRLGRSEGRFGSRLFVFTDDLDVVNRLFDDLRDAEAYTMYGRPDAARRPLAALRGGDDTPDPRRERLAQNWWACDKIGRPLQSRLQVSRTTSQDAGVSASDVVVATASLELGFNDDSVGGVLQHKAPRSMAAFVQRRGRAGRTTKMRPWMITVLSDYGRDRLAYETYDQLFDPVVPRQQLPIRNTYILRMQAVLSFIDWLAVAIPRQVWWWEPLRGPSSAPFITETQRLALEIIDKLLDGDHELARRLATHLKWALGVSEDDVKSILWEAPRPLMLEVLPTLRRRLVRQWRLHPEVQRDVELDYHAKWFPLPDFVPANLFSDLNVPEVRVVIPPHADDVEEREEYLPIAQAMRMLAPGKVTRRFAFERGELNHWIPIPYDQSRCSLPVSVIAESYEYVADVQALVDGVVTSLPCYRPLVMNLQRTPKVVRPTSNSFLDWQSELRAIGAPTVLKTPAERGWYRVVGDIDVYLHGFGTSIMVRRFATQVRASLRLLRQDEDVNVEVRFVDDERQAAIGFEHEVDGLRVAVAIPERDELAKRASGATSRQAWLAAYVRDLVQTDEELSMLANPFQRDWLHQIYVAALIYECVQSEGSLTKAADQIRNDGERAALAGAMQGIFRIDPMQDDEPDREQRLRTTLLGLVRDDRVLARLEACARQLWEVDTERFGDWLRARVHETLAEAVLAACTTVAIDHVSEDSLLLDLARGVGDVAGEFWITESSLGGSGVVEAVAQAFTSDRRSFFRGVEAALAPSDLETTATNLEGFARLLVQDEEVATALSALRTAPDLATRGRRHAEFQRTLVRKGIVCDHAFDVAIAHRYLRGGMNPAGDRLIADLLADWDESQERTGCVIPLRVYCLLAARSASLKPRVAALVAAATGAEVEEWELASVLSGVLWPRVPEVRGKTFDRYSPFRVRGHTDPSLARELLFGDGVSPISLSAEGRVALLHKDLATNGVARLRSSIAEAEAMTAALLHLVAIPVDVEYLQFYPTVESVARSGTEIIATILLRDWA